MAFLHPGVFGPCLMDGFLQRSVACGHPPLSCREFRSACMVKVSGVGGIPARLMYHLAARRMISILVSVNVISKGYSSL